MNSRILVSLRVGTRPSAWLDIATGRLTLATGDAGARRGSASTIGDATFALYADAGTLWFQWNDRRWDLADPGLQLTYGHHLAQRTTTFTASDQSITYPAWWIDDPAFEPMIPEQDRQEDYLAYVVFLKDNPDLQPA
jgi:hypothetical protein